MFICFYRNSHAYLSSTALQGQGEPFFSTLEDVLLVRQNGNRFMFLSGRLALTKRGSFLSLDYGILSYQNCFFKLNQFCFRTLLRPLVSPKINNECFMFPRWLFQNRHTFFWSLIHSIHGTPCNPCQVQLTSPSDGVARPQKQQWFRIHLHPWSSTWFTWTSVPGKSDFFWKTHQFSGSMLNFGGVWNFLLTKRCPIRFRKYGRFLHWLV